LTDARPNAQGEQIRYQANRLAQGSVLLDRYEENKTMARNLAYLLPENLYRVFNETDLDKRKAAIADLWNEDGIFIDPLGVHQGHEKLNAAVTALQHQFPGSVFRVTSPIQENFGVGRDSWEYGPSGGAGLEKGIDVGRMKDGKLVALYVGRTQEREIYARLDV
jgi:SnoaL-like domain